MEDHDSILQYHGKIVVRLSWDLGKIVMGS